MSEGSNRGASGPGPRAYESFAESFEQAYRRLRITSAAAALSAAGVVACNPPPESSGQAGSITGGTGGGTGGVTSGIGGTGGTGGVTDPCAPVDAGMSGGVSDTTMIALSSISMVANATSKLKIRVKPVDGADLAQKAVFVTYRPFFDRGPNAPPVLEETVVQATYVATLPDGNEEWQALIEPSGEGLAGRTPLMLFRVWYQDGAGGLYFDDNHGEQHMAHCLPTDSVSFFPCTVTKKNPNLTITDAGFSGQIGAVSPRLDPDDVVIFKWTPDNWTTVYDVPMSVVDTPDCATRTWTVDIDVPGTFTAIKYVIEYKHGTVNGAKEYKLWDDNNGAGYLILK